MSLIFECGHCDHKGVRGGNGYATWCALCGMNNKLTMIEDTKVTRRTVNGNLHLANMEVREYNSLKFVTESPQDGAVKLTIYRGEETTPLSTETYDNNVSCNLDKHK